MTGDRRGSSTVVIDKETVEDAMESIYQVLRVDNVDSVRDGSISEILPHTCGIITILRSINPEPSKEIHDGPTVHISEAKIGQIFPFVVGATKAQTRQISQELEVLFIVVDADGDTFVLDPDGIFAADGFATEWAGVFLRKPFADAALAEDVVVV